MIQRLLKRLGMLRKSRLESGTTSEDDVVSGAAVPDGAAMASVDAAGDGAYAESTGDEQATASGRRQRRATRRPAGRLRSLHLSDAAMQLVYEEQLRRRLADGLAAECSQSVSWSTLS